jgi:hypothetical protein
VTSSPVEPEDARRAAEEILARPEYQEPEPSLLDRILDAAGDLLGRTFDALGPGAGGVVGTVVVLLVLVLAGWLLRRALRVGGRGPSPAVEVGAAHGTEAPEDPEVWAAEAVRLASAGDHRGALRCRYQELAARLVHDRSVPPDPSRTPAELRAELSARRPDLGPGLAEVTERFEVTWYGGAPVGPDAYEAFTRTADGLARSARAVPA